MKKQVNEWILFCEGKEDYDKSYFHTLFWENIEPDDLYYIFKSFPNSIILFDRMNEYLFGSTILKNTEYIQNMLCIEYATLDFKEKKKLIKDNMELSSLLGNISIVEFTDDYEKVENSRSDGSLYELYSDNVGDSLINNWISEEKKYYALLESFYGLTKDYNIAWYLFSPLLKSNVTLEYYYKLNSLRGIYSFTSDKLLISRRLKT